jgi:hypothetical protein
MTPNSQKKKICQKLTQGTITYAVPQEDDD